MTPNPLTQSKTSIVTSGIQLNAIDSTTLAQFYQEMIGLSLIDHKDGYYALGTPDQTVLVEIFPTTIKKTKRTTGLYHMALLLPTKADLGTILLHLVKKQVNLDGASNHGYSNALYLTDPEGNGIEIYADNDKSEWDIREDGFIAGITEAMDADDVLANASQHFEGIPNGTTMGHIHLHVGDTAETLQFYLTTLGLGFKYPYGNQAIFMASGDYHHHLGANIWQGKNLPAPEENQQGLRALVWTASAEDIAYITEQLAAQDIYYSINDKHLSFKDNSGLTNILIQK
ncbi:VOC family protein [Fundicoccus culcitae]|uniref:VOC family protein n=1 Tax=Fundicoccus culcitae TaxID=2969821 RepID=A0ABY5P6W5_9LACT|nr:VOC family protein [Fundicoccus culcitae]UUX34173.1 VOC family protein [Fundicoccus culcitae]